MTTVFCRWMQDLTAGLDIDFAVLHKDLRYGHCKPHVGSNCQLLPADRLLSKLPICMVSWGVELGTNSQDCTDQNVMYLCCCWGAFVTA